MGANMLRVQEWLYHVDRTTSRLLCDVKRRRARLVLRWGTPWEALVLFLFSFFSRLLLLPQCPPPKTIPLRTYHTSPTSNVHRLDRLALFEPLVYERRRSFLHNLTSQTNHFINPLWISGSGFYLCADSLCGVVPGMLYELFLLIAAAAPVILSVAVDRGSTLKRPV